MSIDPILVDLYFGDLHATPNLDALVAAGPPFHGVWFKALEGLYYPHVDWFVAQYRAMIAAITRGGREHDMLVGSYAYLLTHLDGAEQGRAYCAQLGRAGYLPDVHMRPVLDVERAGNVHDVVEEVIKCVLDCATEIHAEFGVLPMLYGGEYLASLGIVDHMGCDGLIIADYNATLPIAKAKKIGWERPTLWQYGGTGPTEIGRIKGYPTGVRGFCGPAMADLSVFVGKDAPTFEDMRVAIT